VRWDAIGTLPCPVARSLSVIGDRWTILVLRDAFLGTRRFDQFQASLGCSPHVLSTRLARLVRHGVLERRPYQTRPVRHEYVLTDKGRDLYPVIAGLLGWGDRWMSKGGRPAITLLHKDCGHETRPTLTCSACGDPLDARSVRARLAAETADARRSDAR
jgi:DNA-binding HxlR family transcriptional regulator